MTDMTDTPARWEPPDWMLPHLEALGLTQQARKLMNGHRADVDHNPVLAVLQQSMADRIQMLRTLHAVGRLVPARDIREGYTVVEISQIPGDSLLHSSDNLMAMARAGVPDQTVIFHGVTTIWPPVPEGLDREGC